MSIVGTVEVAEPSTGRFGFRPSGARLHLWSFVSTALRKKSDLTIDPDGSRKVELFENEKSAQKSNGSNLIQALIGPDS